MRNQHVVTEPGGKLTTCFIEFTDRGINSATWSEFLYMTTHCSSAAVLSAVTALDSRRPND